MEEILYAALGEHEYFKKFFCVVEVEDDITVYFGINSIGFQPDIISNTAKLNKALDIAAEAFKKLGKKE